MGPEGPEMIPLSLSLNQKLFTLGTNKQVSTDCPDSLDLKWSKWSRSKILRVFCSEIPGLTGFGQWISASSSEYLTSSAPNSAFNDIVQYPVYFLKNMFSRYFFQKLQKIVFLNVLKPKILLIALPRDCCGFVSLLSL